MQSALWQSRLFYFFTPQKIKSTSRITTLFSGWFHLETFSLILSDELNYVHASQPNQRGENIIILHLRGGGTGTREVREVCGVTE